jgi:hypothetical protein
MSTSHEEMLDMGMKSLHERYNKELEDIGYAKKLATDILEGRGEMPEIELAAAIIDKLREKDLPATEYLASYATDYLRSSGRAEKDWTRGTLTYRTV